MYVAEHTVHYLEIVTPDVRAVCDVYEIAHGWQFETTGPELGDALVAVLPDGSLCGVRAPMSEQEQPIVRTYVRVTDLEGAVERVVQAGGVLALEPMEIAGRGRIAIYLLGGVQQGLWQLP